MCRQQQLEEAVKEARKVNQMIEEERQKMRTLKARLQENNLSQYVKITAQEIKQASQSQKAGNNQDSDTNSIENSPVQNEEKKMPGLIPPRDPKNGKPLKKDVEPLNLFDDNYAFYMYYLNNTGQLVTPVEQMFQTNEEKKEQLRKFKEDQEKNSRVVKNRFIEEKKLLEMQEKEEEEKKKKKKVESRLGLKKTSPGAENEAEEAQNRPPQSRQLQSRSNKQSRQGSRGGQMSQTMDSAIKVKSTRKQGAPQIIIKGPGAETLENDQNKRPPKLRQQQNKGTILNQTTNSLTNSEHSKSSPTSQKKKRVIAKPSQSGIPRISTANNRRSSSVAVNNTNSKTLDKPEIKKVTIKSGLKKKLRTSTSRSEDGDNSQLDIASGKDTIKKNRVQFEDLLQSARRISSHDNVNSTPLITVKRVALQDIVEQDKQDTSLKGKYFQSALVKNKKPSKSVESQHEQQSTNFQLPPIPKPIQAQTISKIPKVLTRPPLPQVKSNSSAVTNNSSQVSTGGVREFPPTKIPSISLRQGNSLSSASNAKLSSRDSLRESSDSERRNAAKIGKDYYKEVKNQHKPKVDPKKQMEIEIRQNSVNLSQLELSQRAKPIKKIQLSDLL